MIIQSRDDIRPSEITDQRLYRSRRRFLRGGAALALGCCAPVWNLHSGAGLAEASITDPDYRGDAFPELPQGPFSTDEPLTPYADVTTYNNFYEFSTDKQGPVELSRSFRARPWAVTFDGEIEKPSVWDVDDLIKRFPPEERIYRLRCVEAWSMVIPWVGIPLATVIKALAPTSKAKFVRFETLYDPQRMPGQARGLFGSSLDWPYVEGLRIDEATNELTLLGVGLYGELMPNQNGAPIRLVVPWKYGFKSIKSIVRVSFTEQQPLNTWQSQAPHEYGFYANVNPNVSHPRWSQARERRIGDFLKRPTLIFNGYGEQVAHLYSSMDLSKYY